MARRPEPAARKSLGQHFLRDSGVILNIVGAVRVPDGGVLVEIGAGTGQLTEGLIAAGHEIIALEIEPRLVQHLQQRFQRAARLTVIQDDGRSVDYAALVGERPFAVAGNLPYFAANPILRHLLESPARPTDIVIMVQREVARRIAAAPGRLSLLGISAQVYADPQFLFDVPPEAFDPPPKVWSTVLRLTPREQPRVPLERMDAFFDMVARTFRNPRKHLHNALAMGVALPKGGAGEALEMSGIDPMRRPETLSIEEWLTLLGTTEAVRHG